MFKYHIWHHKLLINVLRWLFENFSGKCFESARIQYFQGACVLFFEQVPTICNKFLLYSNKFPSYSDNGQKVADIRSYFSMVFDGILFACPEDIRKFHDH